jgi:transcription elongation factor Elf1
MYTLLIIFIGLLLITVCSLGYACYNLIRKIEVYEDWVDTFREESDGLYQKLKAVDDRNLFEKDDDVGFVFSEILRITKEFNDKVK